MHIRVTPDGRLHTSYSGETTKGEGNVEEVANLVVILLNEWGEGWSAPHRPTETESGEDMFAEGPRGRLSLQVTRVPHDPTQWKAVAEDGHTSRVAEPAEYANELIGAIRQKASKYSAEVKATAMLVLDGQRSIAFDTPPVLNAFSEAHLAEAMASGFGDVFLLGCVRFINLLVPHEDSEWFRIG
jgi:hypothetical protein